MKIDPLSRHAYAACLREAGVSAAFVTCFLGEEGFKSLLHQSVFDLPWALEWPPCFVPLLKESLGPELYGAVLHPLVPERPLYFAQLVPEGGDLAEVARTEAQFIDLIAMQSMVANYGFDESLALDEPIAQLLDAVGLTSHIPALTQAAINTGIVEDGLCAYVPGFVPDWPLSCRNQQPLDSYTGHFPLAFDAPHGCPYEYNYLEAAWLAQPPEQPREPGLSPAERWLALQAPGTAFVDARVEVEKLQSTSNHPLYAAWLSATRAAEYHY